MTREVAVYRFRDLDDHAEFEDGEPAPFGVLSLHIDLVAIVDVEMADEVCDDEVAARAWVEAVGRHRQSLCIGRGATNVVLKKRIDLAEIVSKIQPAPAGIAGASSAYILTYSFGWGAVRAETWLIDTSPYWAREAAVATEDERTPQVQASPVASGLAVLRALWEPQLN